MNTNKKGTLGQIKIIESLYNQGFSCFLPFDDYSPIDVIAVNSEGYCNRIQIKARTKDSRGKYEIHFSSVVNGKRISIDKSLIDYYAIYMADINQIRYISIQDFASAKSFSFREDNIDLDVRLLKELL